MSWLTQTPIGAIAMAVAAAAFAVRFVVEAAAPTRTAAARQWCSAVALVGLAVAAVALGFQVNEVL